MKTVQKYFLVSFLVWMLLLSTLISLGKYKESAPENEVETQSYYSKYCNCSRQLVMKKEINELTWCSDESNMRGTKQKIVSYSLYGNFGQDYKSSSYYVLLRELPKQVRLLYPDWLIRIYHNIVTSQPEEHKLLCEVYCSNVNVDLCNVSSMAAPSTVKSHADLILNMNPRLWRYLPLLDRRVDYLLSRDVDAELSDRELAAVNQWLNSNYTFHIIRDHQFHCYTSPNFFQPILAGLFGIKVNQRRDLVEGLMTVMTTMGKDKQFFVDQDLLAKVFWPVAKQDAMIHDSHCCQFDWGSLPITPFPTQRLNLTFISDRRGSSWARPIKCPVQCRPPDHQDWEYC